MTTKVGKFSFKVPDGHAEAGTTIEKAFDYQEADTDVEALQVIADKKWSVKALVNDNLKANARSNSYQTALLPYKPSEVSPEEIRERMIRDYIRLGVSEADARRQVEGMVAAQV